MVRLVDDGNPKWDYLTNIGLGVLFIVVIVWLILSVWSKIRRNLLISWIILIIIFIVRASVGITNLMGKFFWNLFLIKYFLFILLFSYLDRYRKNKEEIAIFTTQMTVHLFGILATMILSRVA